MVTNIFSLPELHLFLNLFLYAWFGTFRGNLAQQEHIFRIIRTEYYVKTFALHKQPNTPSLDLPLQEKYIYHVESTGATITAECCVNLIYKYCEKLPKDRYACAFNLLMFVDLQRAGLVLW
jgi:hypothetical protein